MIKTIDGTPQTKRISTGVGERTPLLGGRKLRAIYTATGGETSIDLSLLTPALSYAPGNNQISIKRSSGGNPISGYDFYELTPSSIGFPISDPLIASEIVEINLEFQATGVMACTPRPDVYTGVGTVGQTLITANFSWPYNLNSGSGIGAVKLIIEGIIQTRGSENDYTEVNLSTANTNQILLTTALLGGEKIIVLPTYQMIDQSAAASTFYGQAYSNMQNALGAGTQAFIDQSTLISVPNTTIVGRAQIPDLANDLRASLGIERIPTQQVILLQNEFGPNGEPVYSANDDRGLIRFIGNWTQHNSSYGVFAGSDISGYLEISFYGNALNVLTLNDGVRNYMVSIDGGSETGPYWPSAASGILGNRNYAANQIVNVASGLTLGLHTAKIRAGAVNMVIMGFEILNVNTSGLVNINPGTAYKNGTKYTNTLVDSVAYNTGVTGTTGGRIVRYLNADGSMGQAFTACGTPAYLTSTDHTNEEVARTYFWREFGSGRGADDFSLLPNSPSSDRAFTLEDGNTSLIGSAVLTLNVGGTDILSPVATNSYVTLIFIGCGLDIIRQDSITATGGSYTLYIDGVNQGSLSNVGSTLARRERIVSGLPYGTHTVKIFATSVVTYNFGIKQFIVYQPKKPIISGIEICDYNVLANFVQNSTTSVLSLATGIIKKTNTREWIYVEGTGGTVNWATGLNVTVNIDGWGFVTDRVNSYYETTFFGTGFDLRVTCASNSSNSELITLNGLTLNTTNFPTLTGNNGVYGSTLAFNTGTGVLSSNNGGARVDGCGFWVKNLPLAKYTIRILNQTAGSYLYTGASDFITPIHSYKSNLYADLQNTLPVGSQSLMDTRKISMIKEALPANKAWAQAVGIYSGPNNYSASMIPMTDMSVTIKTTGNPLEIHAYAAVLGTVNGQNIFIQLCVDGILVGKIPQYVIEPNTGRADTLTITAIVPVGAGTHKVDLYWHGNGVLCVAETDRRLLWAKEI